MPAPALLKLSRALHGVTSLEEVMRRVRASITETTRYHSTYIHLINPDGKTFEILGWPLPNMEMVRQRMATIDVSQDRLLQRVVTDREPYFIEDLRLDPDADQKQVEFFGNRTCIVVPMFDGDERIGPLVISTYADQGVLPPTREEFDFFVQVGSLVGVVIGRLRVEEARRALEKSLADAQRHEALGKLAGGIAHDFNNLLLTILANVELATAELGEHPAIALLKDVEAAAQRAARLTKQLLASARGQILSRAPLPLELLLADVRELVERLLPERITLTVEPTVEELVLFADRDQLGRVFMNLVLNARDAIDGDGVITIHAERVSVDDEFVAARGDLPPGGYARVSISDDGTGMSLETQSRIFEPFFTTKASERGTGLGLSVVLGIVEQHDGRVHVYSEEGLGTTFKVYLPLSDQSPSSMDFLDEETPSLSTGCSILVVDDDDHVRRTVERILSRVGHAVTTADGPATALRRMESASFDLLLTDIVMPDGDGVALAERAKALIPDLRVLYMTGYSRVRLRSLSELHLTKPFSSGELRRLVQQTLRGRGLKTS